MARSSGRGSRNWSLKKTSSSLRDALDRVPERACLADHLADLVAQDLGVEELLGVLPLVERLGLVQALVALQADQLAPERGGQHLGELGLADAGGPFHQDRLLELAGEVDDSADRPVGDVVLRREAGDDVVDAVEHGVRLR